MLPSLSFYLVNKVENLIAFLIVSKLSRLSVIIWCSSSLIDLFPTIFLHFRIGETLSQ